MKTKLPRAARNAFLLCALVEKAGNNNDPDFRALLLATKQIALTTTCLAGYLARKGLDMQTHDLLTDSDQLLEVYRNALLESQFDQDEELNEYLEGDE